MTYTMVAAWAVIGLIIGFVGCMFLTARKVEAIESQLFQAQKQNKSFCDNCLITEKLRASELDVAAVSEDRKRLINSNNQLRAMVQRLADRLKVAK